jgi:hypothetical protein
MKKAEEYAVNSNTTQPTSDDDYSDAYPIDNNPNLELKEDEEATTNINNSCVVLPSDTTMEHSDIENYSKAALLGTHLDEDTMPPNPSHPLCALQQMMQKPSSWCNDTHYMLTALSIEEISGQFPLQKANPTL